TRLTFDLRVHGTFGAASEDPGGQHETGHEAEPAKHDRLANRKANSEQDQEGCKEAAEQNPRDDRVLLLGDRVGLLDLGDATGLLRLGRLVFLLLPAEEGHSRKPTAP